MPNQLSGQSGPSPRCHSKHQRHAKFARETKENFTRPNAPDQFSTFLTTQATRLSTTTIAIFNFLKKNTADRIRNAANTGQLS